jgi:CRISPR-associated protein Csx14
MGYELNKRHRISVQGRLCLFVVKAEDPNCLIVYLPGRRVRGIGFRLTTTAQTHGQLVRAQQEVERWIEKEVR